ncbi:MAG: carboxylating nicotinate-nucleotide diphosphorylase, partial [Gemmatimonadetes bacterium]|nr:carboxylating nicotinate-nucleotide diphosphorylase [Gemmatimonadota bacterium]
MIDAAVEDFLRAALEEDLGDRGDLTSQSTIAPDAVASGSLVARQAGCIGGLDAALRVFTLVDPNVEVTAVARDGSMVQAGDDLATLVGSARSLLAAERLALNLLGQLSGVATATRALVDAVAGTNATVVDTRKTVPGMRALQKAAVRAGGGGNHRMGLYDAVLIKDNHVATAGSPAAAVRAARSHVGADVTIEVEI